MSDRGFIDRVREMQGLEDLWAASGAHLFVLYGRRRVGKTELLWEFSRGKRQIYFQAARVTDADNRRYFLREAAEAIGDDLPARAEFGDWEAPLEYLAGRAAEERLLVVLDEFPYLCEGNDAMPSMFQRFWDQHGRASRLMLVLCGSSVGFMEEGVLSERSPLFGRRAGQLELLPMGYREAAAFLPSYGPTDLVRAFGVLGGMPMYQQQFDPSLPFAQNVLGSVLRADAFLHNEPEYLLRTELRDPRTYNSLLEALSSGLTKHNEIAQRIGRPASAIGPYLATLERLRLIDRVSPITSRWAGKRAAGRYFVRDQFLRFWYRFVLPNRSLLEIGRAAEVWERRIAPQLDQYLGSVFEDICREYMLRHAADELGVLPESGVGRFWSRDVEIDILCRDIDGSHYCGECKWSTRPVGESVLTGLRRKAQSLPPSWQERLSYVLFSRSGFTDALRGRARAGECVLVDIDALYGAQSGAR